MKFKLLVKAVEKILGMADKGDAPRADMYLPDFLLALSLVLLGGGSACVIAFFFVHNIWLIPIGAGVLIFGIAALLCWKNQTIHILTGETFQYTTFWGNSRTYHFRDITGLRQNSDSMTLFVGKDKIHIESMAILSPRLVQLLNEALENSRT